MPTLRRLGAVAEDELDSLHLDLRDPPRHQGRPHVVLNFVMTADGRVSYRGRAEIGQRLDRLMMFHIRSLADAVMVGAGTLRVDPFAPTVAGSDRQPLAVVVSGSGDLPLTNKYFTAPIPRLVFTTESSGLTSLPATEVVAVGEREVDLVRALGLLAERGVRTLLCEGGPILAGQLLALGLVDELFLTHATLVTAEPGARRLFEGPATPDGVVRLERVSLHASPEGEWYERSRIRYS